MATDDITEKLVRIASASIAGNKELLKKGRAQKNTTVNI